jgi:predicted ABC-type ATPase
MTRSLIVVAGPNGSGKSTFTSGHDFGVPLLDPDAIARKYEAGTSRIAKAAREFVRTRNQLLGEGKSLAIETTLSGKEIPLLMLRLKGEGVRVILHYICTAGANQAQSLLLSKLRILNRVKQGGHGISNDDVERRFPRSIANLQTVSRWVDEGYVYNNAGIGFQLIAEKAETHWHILVNDFGWLTSGLKPKLSR